MTESNAEPHEKAPGEQAGSLAIDTAMVMAAGLGTRMRPLTDDRPKALVEVAGRALIDHVLDRLAADGVARAVVNLHHFADRLEAHLGARSRPEVILSDERDVLLETGGALVRARATLGPAPIFIANIDSLWQETPGSDPALARLRAAWDGARMDALLLLAPLELALGFDGRGDFHLAEGGVLRRPAPGEGAAYAFMGVQVFSPRLIEGFAEERFSLNRMWDRALAHGRACGLVHDGLWMHVGDPQSRADAEARLQAPQTGRRLR